MARLVRAATDRNPPTLGGGGCQVRMRYFAFNRGDTDARQMFPPHDVRL